MITLHLPRGRQTPDLKQEIGSARRIKDKTVRNNTVDGLNKIIQYL